MKITMKTLAAGPQGTLVPGESYDLPAERARPLIDGGYAVPADKDPARPADKRTARRGSSKRASGGE